MDLDGILIMNSESGLPLFSNFKNIDETLFSGLITAIRSFMKDLKLGGLSSFSTDKKYIFVTGREQITTCLISQKNIDFKEIYSLSLDISQEFEKMFEKENLKTNFISTFDKFETVLESILSNRTTQIPYTIKVAEFIKKEFGGNISYKPKLKNKDGKSITFDLVVDNGQNSGLKGKIMSKMHKSFSRDTIFIKAFDDIAGRAEVEEFFETIKSFNDKESDPENPDIYTYFPKKLAIFAPEYSPTVLEEVEKLKRVKNKAYIPAPHTKHLNMHSMRNNKICYVELWSWDGNSYPQKIFY